MPGSVETKIYCRSAAAIRAVDAQQGTTIAIEPPAVLAKAVADIFLILDVSRPSKGRDRLREHLEHTAQLVTVRREAAPSLEPSAIEAAIATALDGVIEAPEPGRSNRFFDAKLRRFYRL